MAVLHADRDRAGFPAVVIHGYLGQQPAVLHREFAQGLCDVLFDRGEEDTAVIGIPVRVQVYLDGELSHQALSSASSVSRSMRRVGRSSGLTWMCTVLPISLCGPSQIRAAIIFR